MNLDPRSVPYRIVENGTQIVGLLVFSTFASSGGGRDIFGFLLFVVLGLAAVGGYHAAYVSRYEYRLTADTFDIQSGVLSRREREIPFDRIQNVDIAQNVVQRALGISEVRLETAGGGNTEARLQYVSRGEADRLQNLISERKRGVTREEAEKEEGTLLFELDQRELRVLGITSANFRLVGFIFVGLSFVGSPVAARQVSPRAGALLFLGPAFAVAVLLLLWVGSGVQAVLRYYGFRLTRHDEELRYRRGLIQQYNGTIPLSKIQTVMIRENVLARALGYASLVIETAGYAPGQESDSVESAVPIAKRDRVLELAQSIEPVGDLSFTRPPKRARTRYVARYTIVVALFIGVLGAAQYATGQLPFWYIGAGVWLLVPVAAHLKWKQLGYYTDGSYIVTRAGFWTRRTTVVPYHRVQTVADSQTIFQRRRNLRTLAVDTATSGGFWGGDAVALDIDTEAAAALRKQVHDRFQESLRERAAAAEPPQPPTSG